MRIFPTKVVNVIIALTLPVLVMFGFLVKEAHRRPSMLFLFSAGVIAALLSLSNHFKYTIALAAVGAALAAGTGFLGLRFMFSIVWIIVLFGVMLSLTRTSSPQCENKLDEIGATPPTDS